MVAAVQDALVLHLETHIPRIASVTMSAAGSTMLLEALGKHHTSQDRFLKAYHISSDANCGAAFNAATDDTLLGSANGCGQTNPSNGASKPSTSPVCS